MVRLNHTALHRLKVHAMKTYPEECCGVLLGTTEGPSKTVCDVIELKNMNREDRDQRFLIPPEHAEERAHDEGVHVVGFYHSHPDFPAQPSQLDLEHALPWWSYVIVAVEDGVPAAVKSWIMEEDRSGFHEEELEVMDGEFKHLCK